MLNKLFKIIPSIISLFNKDGELNIEPVKFDKIEKPKKKLKHTPRLEVESLILKNHISKRYGRGVLGNQILKLTHKDGSFESLEVPGVIWANNKRKMGDRPTAPTEDGEYYILSLNPYEQHKSKFPIIVDEGQKFNKEKESGVFIHPGLYSWGCIVTGRGKLGKEWIDKINKAIKDSSDNTHMLMTHKVIDERTKTERLNMPGSHYADPAYNNKALA
jgi:hypothetical protein